MSETRSWSWRHAVLKSGLPSTTRHVLLTISCFMNDVGGGCYPTQEQLAEASGLTDRAVRKHIDAAVEAGWLVKREHGFRGQKWRNHEYEASWPTQHTDAPALDVEKGAEPHSARSKRGQEPRSGKVRNHVPTILPDHSSNPSLRSDSEREQVSFDDVWNAFPRRPMTNRSEAEAAFNAIDVQSHSRVLTAATRYHQWHLEDAQARKVEPAPQLEYRTGLAKWLRSGQWVEALTVPLKSDPVPATAEGLVVLPPDHPDFIAVERLRGRKVIIGQSGKATFRLEEIQQARRCV